MGVASPGLRDRTAPGGARMPSSYHLPLTTYHGGIFMTVVGSLGNSTETSCRGTIFQLAGIYISLYIEGKPSVGVYRGFR